MSSVSVYKFYYLAIVQMTGTSCLVSLRLSGFVRSLDIVAILGRFPAQL